MRDGGSPQLLAQQQVEWLGQLPANLALVIEEQPLEKGEIELPPHPIRRLAIGCLAVPHSGHGLPEIRLGLLEVADDLGQATFGIGDLAGQPILLALEQVQRQGIGVVRCEELLAFAFQLAQPTLLGAAFAVGIGSERG